MWLEDTNWWIEISVVLKADLSKIPTCYAGQNKSILFLSVTSMWFFDVTNIVRDTKVPWFSR